MVTLVNINTLDTDGKKGHLYLDKNGQVHIKMLNKVIQRAKLLKQYANNYNPSNNNGSIFENNSCDTSFTSDNYDIGVDKSASSNQQNNNTNNHFIIKQKELNGQSKNEVQNFHNDYGLSPYECFELTYNKDNNEFTLPSNELDGVARDADKGIKVDRIFVDKSILDINSDYWLEIYKNIKKRETKCQQYIQNIIEVLIKNFPNGDIRIIDGQNFEIIKTEDFIKTYVQDKDEKNFYLSELEKKRESMQQHKEEQMITSKYQEDTSLHTSHNKEVDNQQKRKSTQNKEEQIITSKDLKDISLHTSHNNEIDNQQKRESTQNKEEQIITSKYQEDTSLHTSRNKENISMPQQEQAMDNQRKNYNNHQSKSFSHTQPAKDTASNLIKKHSEVLNQPNIGNNNIIPNSTNTNENNKNNNNSGLHLCSRWKQCWERCW